MQLKQRIIQLYEGETLAGHRFRYALLIIDLLTIVFLVVSSFFRDASVIEVLDIVFGSYLALDFVARLWISPIKWKFLVHPLNLTDLVALSSFLLPFLSENYGFLRCLRVLRFLKSNQLRNVLRKDSAYFKQHEDVILSATNLFIFVFLMTELVLVTQRGNNADINNFLDALYFTVTTLTTTGFGDVTLKGEIGRLLAIIIMIFGVSLFLRLIQTMFRPSKVRFTCDECGLFLHENDAVHCKHCGVVLNIPSDGFV